MRDTAYRYALQIAIKSAYAKVDQPGPTRRATECGAGGENRT